MTTLSPAVAFWCLVAMQAAHSAEESLTGFWRWFPVLTAGVARLTGFFPVITASRGQFIAANVIIVLALSVVGAFFFMRRRWALRAAFIIGVAEVINGVYHVGATVVLGRYFPGAVSGIGLIIIGVLFLKVYAAREGTSTAGTSAP